MTVVDTAQGPVAKPRRADAPASRQPQAALNNKSTPSKSAIVAKLLARPKGATVAEVSGVTGWQDHSVRAFFSGLRKKGRVLEREARKNGTSSYRLRPNPAEITTQAPASTTSASDDGMPVATGGEA